MRVRAHEKREHARSKGASEEWAASIERVQLGSRCIWEKGRRERKEQVCQQRQPIKKERAPKERERNSAHKATEAS